MRVVRLVVTIYTYDEDDADNANDDSCAFFCGTTARA